MVLRKTFLTTVLALFMTPAAFACDYPQKPDLPIGSKATKDEMLEAQRSVKDYMAQMEAYLSCIDKEEQQTVADNEFSDEERVNREAALNKKYNAAVQEMELFAARFNEQVRDYKDQGR